MSEPQSQQEVQSQQETPSEQDIQAEIEQTRERLGETVEELVAKADVKARAKDKAAELKAKAQVKAAEAKTTAQLKAAEAKTTAQAKAAGVKAKAQGQAGDLPGQVQVARAKAAELSSKVSQHQLVQRRWPVAAVAGAVVIAGLIIVWRRRASR
jgi:cobalamin biosynthesis Mg chelatase CobN